MPLQFPNQSLSLRWVDYHTQLLSIHASCQKLPILSSYRCQREHIGNKVSSYANVPFLDQPCCPPVHSTVAPMAGNGNTLTAPCRLHRDRTLTGRSLLNSCAFAAHWQRGMCARPARIRQPLCKSAVIVMRLRRSILCGAPARNRRVQCKISNHGFWGTKGEYAEGKIKEHGTTSPMFWKISLPAHCLGDARAAPHFLHPWYRDFRQVFGYTVFY